MNRSLGLALASTALCLTLACGVKGPPLPPLPETPQKSDQAETAGEDLDSPRGNVVEEALRGAPPSPSPSPSPRPSPRKAGGR